MTCLALSAGLCFSSSGVPKNVPTRPGSGTVFLDEIGELPLPLQAKLLRVVEEHTFRRIGGTRNISADLRFVAATNVDLEKAIEARRFRSDLYYRLNAAQIQLPPLRE